MAGQRKLYQRKRNIKRFLQAAVRYITENLNLEELVGRAITDRAAGVYWGDMVIIHCRGAAGSDRTHGGKNLLFFTYPSNLSDI